jgi:hypothetical protein
MSVHVVCRGTVFVGLPPQEAIELFTAEGERRWVDGWDPAYPAGPQGPVFLTHGTVWVVVDAGPLHRRYARVTPGDRAGTVEVRCRAAQAGTEAEVVYDVTALSGDLAEFERAYPDMLAEWERLIAGALAGGQ